VLDPGLKEEAARGGALTVVANAHKELCAVHKGDGIGLSLPQARAVDRIPGLMSLLETRIHISGRALRSWLQHIAAKRTR